MKEKNLPNKKNKSTSRGTKIFNTFFENEKAGGLLLIACTLFSLLITNASTGASYLAIWHFKINHQPLEYWINDGLMTVFFLLIGLELKREIYVGELSSLKKASLPIFAAIGGMLVPVTLYSLLNFGTNAQTGAGIPMATDIAFAIGVLSLLGKKIPVSLKIFLTALAVIDDLGAILVIAFFYTETLNWFNLAIIFIAFAALLILNKKRIDKLPFYLIIGFVMWLFMLNSGVHATITGILIAFVIPFNKTSSWLQNFLHKPVAFFILPLFALANTAIVIENKWQHSLLEMSSIGIFIGLVLGKPIGITLFSYLGYKLKLADIANGLKWKYIIGVSFLGGIGFTMSIFITLLAYTNSHLINSSKIAIMLASSVAATIGFFWLKITFKSTKS